jgi:putative PIN family toxin of toxin-antitoxin system
VGNAGAEWVASAEILAEYREVLRRPKFGLSAGLLAAWDERFSTLALWPVAVPVDFPRDAKDAKFLACALAAEADYLITGDRDFEDAPAIGKTRVLSAARFHAEVGERNRR